MKLTLSATLAGLHHVWPLDGPVIRIGRGATNLVEIPDASVSRDHAEVVRRGEDPWIRDLGSHNGTYVNGVPIRRPVRLSAGDRIRLGRIELLVMEAAGDRTSTESLGETVRIPEFELSPLALDPATALLDQLEGAGRLLAAHGPLEGSCRAFLEAVGRAVPVSRLALLLQPGPDAPLRICAGHGASHDELSVCVPDRIQRAVLETGKAVLESEKGAPDASAPGTGTRTRMAVPLLQGGQALGLLYAEHDALPGGYSRRHRDLFQLFANMAAFRVATEHIVALERRDARAEEEATTASRIQRWILPQSEIAMAGYDVHALFRPCEAIGGDFYDVSSATDHTAWIVLGDVSGKGICGALLMAVLVSSARVLYRMCPGPGELANSLNRILLRRADLGHFATAFIGRLHTASGVLHYVNAGHPYPLHWTPRGIHHVESTGLPLGIDPQANYQDETLMLHPRDVLAIFSDGLTEVTRRQALYGEHRIAAALRAAGPDSTSEQLADAVLADARRYAGEGPFQDDIAMLVLKRSAQTLRD